MKKYRFILKRTTFQVEANSKAQAYIAVKDHFKKSFSLADFEVKEIKN